VAIRNKELVEKNMVDNWAEINDGRPGFIRFFTFIASLSARDSFAVAKVEVETEVETKRFVIFTYTPASVV
jgi:hypothetical protein